MKAQTDPTSLRNRAARRGGRWIRIAAAALVTFVGSTAATWKLIHLRQQTVQSATAAIEEVGGTILNEWQGPNWLGRLRFKLNLETHLSVFDQAMAIELEHPVEGLAYPGLVAFTTKVPVGDEILKHVIIFRSLEALSLYGSHVGDVGLQYVQGLTKLRLLNLSGTKITDAGLQHLGRLRNLEELYLDATEISDAGLCYLEPLGSLRRLSLSNTRVTDDGLQSLSRLPQLKVLNLEQTEISDAGLRHLGELGETQQLTLSNTRITNEGLQHLGRLLTMDYLALDRTGVSDRGLTHLRPLVNLKWLDLEGTYITWRGVRELEEAITGLQTDYRWQYSFEQVGNDTVFDIQHSIQQLVLIFRDSGLHWEGAGSFPVRYLRGSGSQGYGNDSVKITYDSYGSQIEVSGRTAKIVNNGKSVVVGKQPFDISGEKKTIVIAPDGSARLADEKMNRRTAK